MSDSISKTPDDALAWLKAHCPGRWALPDDDDSQPDEDGPEQTGDDEEE